MPYTSNPGGLYNSGVFPDTRPKIDVGGLLDAVGSGTGSIIHSIMQRKIAERGALNAQAELTLRQKQLQIEQGRADREQTNAENEFNLRKTAENHRFLEAGGIPGAPPSDETSQEPIAPISPIQRAMSSGTPGAIPGTSGDMPGVQVTPSAAPGAVESPTPEMGPMSTTVHNPVPGHPDIVDPTGGVAYTRAVDVANARAASAEAIANAHITSNEKIANARNTAAQNGREYARTSAILLQDEKNKKGPIAKAMTPGQTQARNERLALGFLQAHSGGTLDDARNTFNNTDEGKALAASGLSENDLLAAYPKMKTDPATGQILGLINSGAAKDIAGATATVKNAKDAAASLKRPPVKAEEPAEPVKPSPVAPKTKLTKPGAVTAPAAAAPAAPPAAVAPAAAGDAQVAADRAAGAAWRAKNPRKGNESDLAYYTRFRKDVPAPAAPPATP